MKILGIEIGSSRNTNKGVGFEEALRQEVAQQHVWTLAYLSTILRGLGVSQEDMDSYDYSDGNYDPDANEDVSNDTDRDEDVSSDTDRDEDVSSDTDRDEDVSSDTDRDEDDKLLFEESDDVIDEFAMFDGEGKGGDEWLEPDL